MVFGCLLGSGGIGSNRSVHRVTGPGMRIRVETKKRSPLGDRICVLGFPFFRVCALANPRQTGELADGGGLFCRKRKTFGRAMGVLGFFRCTKTGRISAPELVSFRSIHLGDETVDTYITEFEFSFHGSISCNFAW